MANLRQLSKATIICYMVMICFGIRGLYQWVISHERDSMVFEMRHTVQSLWQKFARLGLEEPSYTIEKTFLEVAQIVPDQKPMTYDERLQLLKESRKERDLTSESSQPPATSPSVDPQMVQEFLGANETNAIINDSTKQEIETEIEKSPAPLNTDGFGSQITLIDESLQVIDQKAAELVGAWNLLDLQKTQLEEQRAQLEQTWASLKALSEPPQHKPIAMTTGVTTRAKDISPTPINLKTSSQLVQDKPTQKSQSITAPQPPQPPQPPQESSNMDADASVTPSEKSKLTTQEAFEPKRHDPLRDFSRGAHHLPKTTLSANPTKSLFKLTAPDNVPSLPSETNIPLPPPKKVALIREPNLSTRGGLVLDIKGIGEGPSILLVGDSLMHGIGAQVASFVTKTLGGIATVHAKISSGLARPDFFDWQGELPKNFANRFYDYAVIFMGANDGQSMVENGKLLYFGSKPWQESYKHRLGALMDLACTGTKNLIWLGLPPMRSPKHNSRIKALNQLASEVAQQKPCVKFVAMDQIIGTDSGQFSTFLSVEKKHRRVRMEDGVHLSAFGGELVAKVLASELRSLPK